MIEKHDTIFKEVKKMDDYIQAKETELQALKVLKEAAVFFRDTRTADSDIVSLLEKQDHYINALEQDILNLEIFAAYERFSSGKTNVIAYDAANYTGARIIEVLPLHYDWVFGYYEENTEKVFFLTASKTAIDEETGGEYIFFFVENTPIRMDECLK